MLLDSNIPMKFVFYFLMLTVFALVPGVTLLLLKLLVIHDSCFLCADARELQKYNSAQRERLARSPIRGGMLCLN
jgi:hypothetical protein